MATGPGVLTLTAVVTCGSETFELEPIYLTLTEEGVSGYGSSGETTDEVTLMVFIIENGLWENVTEYYTHPSNSITLSLIGDVVGDGVEWTVNGELMFSGESASFEDGPSAAHNGTQLNLSPRSIYSPNSEWTATVSAIYNGSSFGPVTVGTVY